ncbi:Hsp70 family protein [Nocardia cyriacigeorgica]|uniref:Hsp70 family protein n=1 Tax=Nocardia cyriacigeorgica TaxID=135487 RepID=UPI002453E671|nr:Hsp70 family protein [Nocardia cyriacigeorgica]
MTQRLALGITVGSANSVAVLATRGGEPSIDSEPILTHPTVLRLVSGAPATFGTEATSGGRHAPGVRIDGFVARVGDPVPMLADDGTSHSASALFATAVARLVEEAADGPAAVVLCHPAHWSSHTVAMLRHALDAADLPDITLIPEPVAAVRWSRTTVNRTDDEGAVLVYDLGATGLTVSLVRTGAHIELLGTPLHTTEISGAEFDLLLMRYVLANAPDGIDADPFDPIAERELSALRERCRIAKEELSTHTATVVTTWSNPAAPDGSTVRLVRDEVEDLFGDPLRASLASIRDAVHRAGLDIGDVSSVLLTGGGSAIPLLTELISSEFGLPVVAAPDPAHTSARGAAALAAQLSDPADDSTTITVPAVPEQAETEPTHSTPRPLPTATHHPGVARNRRRRVAIIAAAAAAIGLLATGTVAVSTGAGTQHPAAPDHPTSATIADTAATAGPSSPGTNDPRTGTIADSGIPSPNDVVKQPDTSKPGTITVVNSQPGTRTGEPGTPTPAPQGRAPAADPGSAPQPAPGSPATQSPPPAPQSPPPAPQSPAPPPQQPQQPPAQSPNLPTDGLTDTLGDTVGTVGGAVGTVLRAPGEILGGSGG